MRRDSRIDKFKKLVYIWISNIKDEDKKICLKLLRKLNYYSKKKENIYAKFIIDNIKNFDSKIQENIVIQLLEKEESLKKELYLKM